MGKLFIQSYLFHSLGKLFIAKLTVSSCEPAAAHGSSMPARLATDIWTKERLTAPQDFFVGWRCPSRSPLSPRFWGDPARRFSLTHVPHLLHLLSWSQRFLPPPRHSCVHRFSFLTRVSSDRPPSDLIRHQHDHDSKMIPAFAPQTPALLLGSRAAPSTSAWVPTFMPSFLALRPHLPSQPGKSVPTHSLIPLQSSTEYSTDTLYSVR